MGETFDIHGGGLDLIFPHHENEIAQSECCHGKPMAKYWLHNGLMQAADEVGKVGGRPRARRPATSRPRSAGKISKSKGASPFRELLQQFTPETIRFFLLSTHYRRPIEYSEARLRETEAAMEKFYRFFKRYERVTGEMFYAILPPLRRGAGRFRAGDAPLLKAIVRPSQPLPGRHGRRFQHRRRDRRALRTGPALNKYAEDEKLEKTTGRRRPPSSRPSDAARPCSASWARMLGLFRQPRRKSPPAASNQLAGKLMKLLIDLRAESRKKKDFATADRIRNTLVEIGVILEDRPGGTEWSVK